MRTIFLLLILLLSFLNLQAQSNILFEDEFKDNSKDWQIGKSKDVNITIASGKLRYIGNDETETFLIQFIPITTDREFSVEVECTFLDLNSSLGLFFEQDEYEDSRGSTFLVYADNFCLVEKHSEGEQTTLKSNRFLVGGTTGTTVLKVVFKDSISTMFVNDKYFHSSRQTKIYGNVIGLSLSGKIEVERMVVKQLNDGIKLPKTLEVSGQKELLKKNINGQKDFLSMMMSPDGNTMYLSVRRVEDKIHPELYGCDDILYSEKTASGDWGTFKKAPAPLNGNFNSDVVFVSPDNNTLILADTSSTPSKHISFYKSQRTKTGWGKLQRLGVKEGHNKSAYMHTVFTTDGKRAIFSSKMENTKGSCDLYTSVLIDDHTFSTPVKLPLNVNTLGSDYVCFLAPDNRTLYFSSDGHIGYGGSDIFMTRRLDETWTKWSDPLNVGPAINGTGEENGFIVDSKREYAYFTSDDNLKLKEGLYFKIPIPKEIKPYPVVMARGKVLDKKTNLPVAADIQINLLPENKEAGIASSNPQTGEYKILLPCGSEYSYRANVKGYIPVNETMDLTGINEYMEKERDLYLIPIEVGQMIRLNSVFFVQSKSELLAYSYPELDRLIQIMKDNPEMEIELRGYTDNIGDPKENIKLSEERVAVVRNYLVEHTIAATRITGKGFGGANAVTSNATEEGRKQNRRVEFVIVKK